MKYFGPMSYRIFIFMEKKTLLIFYEMEHRLYNKLLGKVYNNIKSLSDVGF